MTTGQSQALELADYGDDVVEVGKGQAKGTEHQTNQDISVPFLRVLQPLSPLIMAQTPGVKLGDILNVATGEIYDGKTGILFACGTTRHAYAAFRDINKGGGYQGQYEIDSEEVAKARAASKEFGDYKLPGNPDVELVETFYQFGVHIGEDLTVKGMAVMPYSSTSIKAYKNWITQVRAHTVQVEGRKLMLPLWAHMFRITTVKHPKSTDKQMWWIPVLTPYKGSIAESVIGPKTAAYQAAKSAGVAMDSGLAKVDYAQQAKEETATGDAAPF